jgi:hypothetical protein
MATVNEVACSGLKSHAKIQIDHRAAIGAPPREFRIQKYLGITYPQWLKWPLLTILPFHSTKILFDRLNPLPMKDSWCRQFVVRLKTRQSLDKGDGKGPRVANLTEYVVIQKLRIQGAEEPWKIWGTIHPSTMEEIDDMLESGSSDAGQGMMERLNTMTRTMMSG